MICWGHRLFLGHLFSHCELLRRIEDPLRARYPCWTQPSQEFSLAERLLTGRCPVDPDKLDRPVTIPARSMASIAPIAMSSLLQEHKLDFIPIIRKPLFHEGGGLVSLPVCDPACDLLDGTPPPSFRVSMDHSVRIRESWWFVSPSRRT